MILFGCLWVTGIFKLVFVCLSLFSDLDLLGGCLF